MDNAVNEPVAALDAPATAARPARYLEIWLPVLIVALDQASKAAIRAMLPLHDSVTIIKGFMDFTHVLNSGAAFGILSGVDFPFKTAVIAIVATAALIGVGDVRLQPRPSSADCAHRPGADPGRCGRQPDRSNHATGSVVDFVERLTGAHYHFWCSTSPIRRLRSAWPS